MSALLVRGGTLVLETGALRADVLVRDGRVAALGSLDAAGAEVLDATGLLVLPGGVDAHTHVGIEFGAFRTRDDFATATRAAALGGTTTILEFALTGAGESPAEAVRRRIGESGGRSWVDVGFHAAVLRSADGAALAGIEVAAALGAPSVKVFTAYRGVTMLELGDVRAVMEAARRARSLVMVHAETETLVERAGAELRAAGRSHARFHALARPPVAELDAARSVLGLAEDTGAAVYLVHVTSPAVCDALAQARARGVRAFAESCPHYLLLDDEVYAGPHPERFVCSPPLRPAALRDGLWRRLGTELTGVHSDHCAFDSAQKAVNADDSSAVPPGLPGVETRLPVMLSEALAGRLPLPAVARLCASEPARLFGLPRKGSLLPGFDGDLAVVDPAASTVVGDGLHMGVDHSPFAGRVLRGQVVAVALRGRLLVRDGRWAGEAPTGCFQARSRLAA